MSLFSELRKRRVFPWVGAFLAGGFIALEAADQLIGYEMLPVVAYPVALAFYLFGIPSTIVLAWFHGERGPQKPPKAEVWLHTGLLVGAVASSIVIVRTYEAGAARPDVLAAAGLDPAGVAVLYFEDFSPNGELGYLADGLTEALTEALSSVRALDVVSLNGVEQYRARQVAPDSIARALGVASLVDGSVEQVGDELRITTRLLEGLSGTDIDRATFRLPVSGILAAQDSVVESVSRALRRRVGEEIQLRDRQRGTDVPEAWALVQRAEGLQRSASERSVAGEIDAALAALTQADGLLELAEQADRDWAEPPTERAVTHFQLARLTVDARDVVGADRFIESGIEHANAALALARSEPTALEYRGRLRYLRWLLDLTADRAEAEQLLAAARVDLEAAVGAEPSLASAHSALSHLYYQTGDVVAVLLAARRAYEEDSYLEDADVILQRLFWGAYDLEQFQDSQQWCREGARRFPQDYRFAECELWLLWSPPSEPDVGRAWAIAEQVEALTGADLADLEHAIVHTLVGGVIGRAGMLDSANAVFERARVGADVDPEQEVRGFEAAARAVAGDLDGAMERLQGYVAGNAQHSFTVGTGLHWWWRPLRDHPGFQSIVR